MAQIRYSNRKDYKFFIERFPSNLKPYVKPIELKVAKTPKPKINYAHRWTSQHEDISESHGYIAKAFLWYFLVVPFSLLTMMSGVFGGKHED